MAQEDKDLLLKYLSAALPYGVKVCIKLPNHQEKIFEEQIGDLKELTIYGGYLVNSKGIDYRSFNLDIKPYLRPMSSMTEEESAELSNIIGEWFDKELFYLTEEPFLKYALSKINYSISPLLFDWLNAHHFDYRGLIEKGLAIEVTEENNPYEN